MSEVAELSTGKNKSKRKSASEAKFTHFIDVQNACEHNLKGVYVKIPRDALCVITGLSGSGKSSLAFDTIYAEGQRRYVESLSAYARQFLDRMQKPDVERIEGLSPAISIEQRNASSNPRSTVGTTTEIYDYLRLLFASIGKPHCPKCGLPITSQTSQEIASAILDYPEETKLHLLAPIVEGRKGEFKDLIKELLKQGYVRARVDGEIRELSDEIDLQKNKKHTIEVVVDRIVLRQDSKSRLTDSIEHALKAGNGVIRCVMDFKEAGNESEEKMFSQNNACAPCGISFGELQPRIFSFNSPYGACAVCDGLGNRMDIDPELVIPDPTKSIKGGAIEAWKRGGKSYIIFLRRMLRKTAERNGFSLDTPFNKLSKQHQKLILWGEEDADSYAGRYGSFEGVIPNLERRFKETESEYMKNHINKYMSEQSCTGCHGKRLQPHVLAVKVNGKSIMDITDFSVLEAVDFFSGIQLTEKEKDISRQILKEVRERLDFMKNVGLGYLTLSRMSGSLSGGEAQRIRLATQIGSGLTGVLYVLDEPSIGLHQRDNRKLLDAMKRLVRIGNTLIVVEHDEETMMESDYLIDLGPGAGEHGGTIVAAGTPKEILSNKNSLTADYLSGRKVIAVPSERRKPKKSMMITVSGAKEHNLRNVTADFPLGMLICVTGVSGSGKSTLVDEILCRELKRQLNGSKLKPGAHNKITGIQNIDKIIEIDQSPIGRTPRSNPATYTGLWGPVREIFSKLPESKVRGFQPGRFSFNVKGGRCDACEGDGVKTIEMHFLPDVHVTCEVCGGQRFNEQTLKVRYKGKNIAQLLDTSVEECLEIFESVPAIHSKLKTLYDVGLGYVRLGQSATTLSGGEAQRVKLATELSKRATGQTLYVLDEPTTGLHFDDVAKLLSVLQRLVDKGNTVVIIEHNLDVIKTADYIIDLGPEGGSGGGQIIAKGTPEQVAKCAQSYTGQYLKKILNAKNR